MVWLYSFGMKYKVVWYRAVCVAKYSEARCPVSATVYSLQYVMVQCVILSSMWCDFDTVL